MGDSSERLLLIGGLATFMVGAIHVQQYADFIKDVPTIGTLFLLNGFAAGLVCLMLATRLRTLAALGGIAVSAGALVSLAIARFASGGLFDYVEPTLRGPVAISVAAEVIAVLCLGAYLAVATRSSGRGRAQAGRPKRTMSHAGRPTG
jgi:hypothetical protein